MSTSFQESVPGSLAALSGTLASMVERVGASTLAVPGRGRSAMATAVVWRSGVVVTAAHVFRRPPATIELVGAEQRRHGASLAGIDPSTDLAVYRLADHELQPIEAADAACVRAGHLALLVGRSLQGDLSASFGMIHRAGGEWRNWLGGRLDRLIRLDGGVHPGLSGGPVADAAGAVFGIASAALSRHYGTVVPASTVSSVIDALLANGRVPRAWLGVAAQPVPTGGAAGAPASGLLVTALVPQGPAAQAGVLLGDILVRVDGHSVESLHDLRSALADRVGQHVPLALIRGGQPTELSILVGRWPDAGRGC